MTARSKIKKILSCILCLAIMLSMNVPALAVEEEHVHIFNEGLCKCGASEGGEGSGEQGGNTPDPAAVPEPASEPAPASFAEDDYFKIGYDGTVGFKSLQQAYDAAAAGDTIVALKSSTGAGLVVNKNITIDFYGYSYTVNSPVGSAGTETLGFQLLKGNDVTFVNGTLKVAEENKADFAILVQNYANLTLKGMTLDGKFLDRQTGENGNGYSCTLSNNCGNVKLEGETNIIANDDGENAFAFDVCKYADYEPPVVTIETTGTISGKYEVTPEIKANLSVKSGSFTADVSEYLAAGSLLTPTESGFTTIANVAEVGGTGYGSVEEAVAAAAEGATVKVLLDHQVAESIIINKKITLDLNGKTISAAKALNAKPVIRVLADVTVTNGTVDGTTGINSYAFIVGNSETAGVLRIADGTYKGITSAVSVTKGTAYISGGNFSTAHDGEGTDYGSQYLLNCMDDAYKAGEAGYAISGGSFVGFNPGDNAAEGSGTNFLPWNLKGVDDGSGTFTIADVSNQMAVAAIGENKFPSLQQAVAASNSGDTVSLLKEVTLSDTLNLTEGTLLDLNGQVLTGTVYGNVALNGGAIAGFIASEGDYISTDAAVTITADGITKLSSGSLTLGKDMSIPAGKSFVVSEGASFTVPQGKSFMVGGSASFDGSFTAEGSVKLIHTAASLKAASGLSVESALEGSMVIYADGVYKLVNASSEARIGSVYFDSFANAFDASQSGDSIVLLKPVSIASALSLKEGTSLDLNGMSLTGTVYGKIIINGGSYINADNHKLIAPVGTEDAYYVTDNASFIIAANSIEIVSGDVSLAQSWKTPSGYTLTVSEGASFTVPGGMGFELFGSAVVNGSITVNGTVKLSDAAATMKAPDGLNVQSGVTGYQPIYEGGVYKLLSDSYVAKVDGNYYSTLSAANDFSVANGNKDIVLIKDLTVTEAYALAAGVKLDLNGHTLTGPVTGTVKTSGGTVVNNNVKLIAPNGEAQFTAADAVVKITADGVREVVSGTVTLGKDLSCAAFNVNSGATLVVPTGKKLEISGSASVEGTLSISGTVNLTAANASITAPAGLTIGTTVADYKVAYDNGSYKLIAKDYVAQLGDTKYETVAEAAEAAKNNPNKTLTLLKDSSEAVTIKGNTTLSLNGKKQTGSVTVAEGAKLTITQADLAQLTNGVKLEKSSIIVGKTEMKLSGTVKTDSTGKLTATPSSGAVEMNGVSLTLPAGAAIIADTEGKASLPLGTQASMNVKVKQSTELIVITLAKGGELKADGTVSAKTDDIDGVSYSKLAVKRGSTDMLYFAPDGAEFSFELDGDVSAAKDGKSCDYLTDGSDSDLYPDLSFDYKSDYFQTGSKKNLELSCNGFFDDLYSLKLQKKGASKAEKISLNKDIEVWEGSTQVKIKNACLNRLSSGTYNLTLTYKVGDGKYQDAVYTFDVGTTPDTGDLGFAPFALTMALSAASAAAILVLLKKKNRG